MTHDPNIPPKPIPLVVLPNNIPADLKALDQWLVWRYFLKDGDWTKPPLDANKSGNAGSSTDPKTWATVEKALSTYQLGTLDGIGLALTEKNGIVGFDLDDCRNPETGDIAPWALKIVEQVPTYWEISTSGTGLRGFGYGRKPGGRCRTGDFEMYSHGRYLCLTGHHLDGTPQTIEAVQASIDLIYAEMFPAQDRQPSSNGDSPHTDDTAIVDALRRFKNGAKFCRLFDDGDISISPYHGDHSIADQGLCRLIAFRTQDPDQVDRIFRLSALFRQKWELREDYRDRTIARAITHVRDRYQGVSAESNGQPSDEQHTSSIRDEPPANEPQKPRIQISTDMPVIVDRLEQAIRTMPKAPHVFQRERKLSVITHEVTPPEWLHRPMDAPAIYPIEAPYLRELASKAAQWERYDDRKKEGEKWVKTLPPEWAIHTLMARPYSRFPILEGLIFAPTIRPDGSILDMPGYDVKTGLYACFKHKAFPPIPQRPTADDARAAIEALKDPFVDFMFARDCHRAATISAICTIVCRFAIDGPVPLFGVSATAPGSGKGLAIDAITMSAIGRTAPRWAQTADHEEERKRLFAIAVEGDPVVHIDNVIHPLGSAALDMVMTAQVVKERKMKTLTNETARIYAVLFASGNNLTYKQTLSRRVVPIDLDPGVERPEERAEFTYNPLLPYVYKRWRPLAVHALTIIRAFYVAKQPTQHLTAFGSFESWSKVIREALVWAGEADPCEGRKDMRAESDLDLEALGSLMACWYACYEDTSVDAKKVAQDLKLYTANEGVVKWCDLQESIRTFSLRNPDRQLTSLQIAIVLRTYKGRIVKGRRFIRVGGNETNAGEWKLETCTST
jgi:NrS-1  polymerase HBD domain